MKVKEVFLRHWLGIISLLVTTSSLVFALYTYWQTKVDCRPIFLVDPVRTEILSSERVSTAPIKVIKNDGNPVVQDLTSIRFFFWNMGKQSIRRENILEPLYIKLSDPNAEVIDYKILKRSRSVTNFDLQPSAKDENALHITFDILEHNDGVSCQLIYEGDPNARLNMSGIIEGVQCIITSTTLEESLFWKKYAKNILSLIVGILILMVGLVLLGGLLAVIDLLFKKVFGKEITERFPKLPKIGTIIAIGLGLIFFFIILPLKDVKKEVTQRIVDVVPTTILPESHPLE